MTSSSSSDSTGTIEAYYHSALEACANASQLEADERPTNALTEYKRAIYLIEGMRSLVRDPRDTDEAYFAGVDDVEGICRVHIAKLEGDLPSTVLARDSAGEHRRRKSNESVNTLGRGGLRSEGSILPQKEVTTPERSRGPRPERQKVSRSPSPEKEKKLLPFSLRTQGPALTRVASADNANIPSQQTSLSRSQAAAVDASRAATLAWQGKKPVNSEPKRSQRNISPSSSRAGSLDINSTKRASISDSASLLDTPLIDFSAPVIIAPPSQDLWTPLSPAPTPPPQPQSSSCVESQPPRRKQKPPSKSLGRSNAHGRGAKPMRLAPPQQSRSASAPDLSEQLPAEVPPISVSISDEISPEEELSLEERALRELKGSVDENLTRTILNEIVVKGDEVQWDDIGPQHLPNTPISGF
jgi:hypothetical protein